jgi:hypothetical protein
MSRKITLILKILMIVILTLTAAWFLYFVGLKSYRRSGAVKAVISETAAVFEAGTPSPLSNVVTECREIIFGERCDASILPRQTKDPMEVEEYFDMAGTVRDKLISNGWQRDLTGYSGEEIITQTDGTHSVILKYMKTIPRFMNPLTCDLSYDVFDPPGTSNNTVMWHQASVFVRCFYKGNPF